MFEQGDLDPRGSLSIAAVCRGHGSRIRRDEGGGGVKGGGWKRRGRRNRSCMLGGGSGVGGGGSEQKGGRRRRGVEGRGILEFSCATCCFCFFGGRCTYGKFVTGF